MNIILKEKFEMKRMGDRYRAWFVNPFGVPFHKDFPTSEEIDNFISRAREVGTKLTGFVSL